MPNVVILGGIVEVTRYWQRDAREINKDDFYPPVMDDVTWQGKLWGTSFGTAPHQPVYNKDLFTRSALPTPGDLAETNQWTWDAMVDLARRATNREGGVRPVQYGLLPSVGLVGAVMWLRSHGGDVLNADRTRVTLDTPGNAEALFNKEFHPPASTKWIVTAYHQGKVLPVNVAYGISSAGDRGPILHGDG